MTPADSTPVTAEHQIDGPVQSFRKRPSRRRRRWLLLAAVIVAAIVAVGVIDPFSAKHPTSSGITGNADPTSLATVNRQDLSDQTEVSATLGYAGTSSIVIPAGTAPAAMTQAQQKVASDQQALDAAQASLANTETSNQESLTSAQDAVSSAQSALSAANATLEQDQATLSAAQQKESIDCSGDAAAGSSTCATDTQAVSTDQQKVTTDTQAVSTDQSQLASAQSAVTSTETKNQGSTDQTQAQVTTAQETLSDDEASLSSDQASSSTYSQSSVYTSLPAVGQVINQGQSLFSIDNDPVVLLYGDVTPWRAFSAGMTPGPDVAELNSDLAALGYGLGLKDSDTFTSATASAIDRLQASLDTAQTGQLLFGSVIFEPGALRVTSVTPTDGTAVSPSTPVLDATSNARQVTIDLDASEESDVAVGDKVTVTLPNGQTTPGVISSVGTVATTPPSGSSSSTPTITVLVNPTDPAATGDWDQAPVNVTITTDSVTNALVVPIDALLAQSNGGYAVEVEGADGVHHLVAVSLGLFDDADGLVQVTGTGLAVGQRVVVPNL